MGLISKETANEGCLTKKVPGRGAVLIHTINVKKTSKPGGIVLAATSHDGCWMAARLFHYKIGNVRL